MDSGNSGTGFFEWARVETVQCIVWLTKPALECNVSDKRALKKRKDALGYQHLETPVLYSKECGDRKVLNNTTLYTDTPSAWNVAIAAQYQDLQVTHMIINGGSKMSVFKHEEPYVTISVYRGTKKIMIQPGAYQVRKNSRCGFVSFVPF